MVNMQDNRSFLTIITAFLERRSGWVILSVLAITALLVLPLLLMDTEELASSEPGGVVFDLRDEANDLLPRSAYTVFLIAEAKNGDFFTKEPLLELFQNGQELRRADQDGRLRPEKLPVQPYLYNGFDVDRQQPFLGIFSIADAVQEILVNDPRLGTTLDQAAEDQVKIAVAQVISDPRYSFIKEFQVSQQTTSRPGTATSRGIEYQIDYWTSPATPIVVVADNEKLGGGTVEINLGGDPKILRKEEFGRNVQAILRGDQRHYNLWGVAIDANLEGQDEGLEAGPFIMFTVIAVLIVVGFSLRSYWAVAITGAGLGILMIWLQGISNLIGLKSGLVVDLIVPIAMISLGVDFAIHALRRYREEKDRGLEPHRALRVGFAGVMGALGLAMITDGVAFFSNVASGIEAVIGFGIAAGIAVISSFIVLGIVGPLAMMRIDRLKEESARFELKSVGPLSRRLAASLLPAFGVIALVAISPLLGIGIIFLSIIIGLLVPLFVIRRRDGRATESERPIDAQQPKLETDGKAKHGTSRVGLVSLDTLSSIVVKLAQYRVITLSVTVLITAAALFFALQLESKLDVKEFFDNKSDFVIGLDKLDEYLGETQGEPAIIFIKGDLTDPKALEGIRQVMGNLNNNKYVGKNQFDGEVTYGERTVFDVLSWFTASPYARAQVEASTGINITDTDQNSVPDTKEQLQATYSYIVQNGIPLNETTLLYEATQVRETLFYDPTDAQNDATALVVGIPGTREATIVTAAREALDADLEPLKAISSISTAGITGSPFTREASLNATTRALTISLPIAAVACLLVIALFMRSLRMGIVTTIPIGLVVAWLYAIMYLGGFHLNFITATIGAISVGVGIDYSIHMTSRFREELKRAPDRIQALRQASSSTGVALLASAASSVTGFAIMGFAPMPMFSAYGILTAIMIFLAGAASLLVLPSLLLLVTPSTIKAPSITGT